MRRGVRIEIDAVAFEDEPTMPEGISEYERQEMRRLWHDALQALVETADRAARLYAEVKGLAVDDKLDYRPMGGTLGYRAAEAEAALVALSRLRTDVHHRLVLANRPDLDACVLPDTPEARWTLAVRLLREIQKDWPGEYDRFHVHVDELVREVEGFRTSEGATP